MTATALVCGMAVLGAARSAAARPAHWGFSGAIAAVMMLVAVFSLAGIVGNGARAAADDAVRSGATAQAEREALRAERWQPWSSEALRVAGEVQLALGRRAEARSTFSRAVARDPLNWELWLDLALASDGRSRVRAARQAERLNHWRAGSASRARCSGWSPLDHEGTSRSACQRRVSRPRRLCLRGLLRAEPIRPEEITSAVFERAVRYRKTYDSSKGSPIAWIVGIARTQIAEQRARPSHAELELAGPADGNDLEARSLERLSLHEAVRGLDDRSRELIALRYGIGFTTREIAAEMGL